MTPPSVATAAPVFSLASETYPTAKTLTISAAAGAEIYLSLTGSAPTTTGEGYYTPISIVGPITVTATALEPGKLPSAPVTATYNVTAPAAATITTVAGSGIESYPGIPGPALQTEFGYLNGVAADSAGNLYMPDDLNSVVWKFTASTKTVSVVAGTIGDTGDGTPPGPAAQTNLLEPEAVALNAAGDLFIADWGTETVYKVSAQTGILSTYAGGGTNFNYPTLGDGGLATNATIGDVEGLAVDASGNLYIADGELGRIRRVDAVTGIITSVAGKTGATTLGDKGLATAAMLNVPTNIAFDSSGNLYIVDSDDARIRKVTAATGIITTVAGKGIPGSSGDGGLATSAEIDPAGLAVDASGAVYFGDVNSTIRKFLPGGNISTIAGTGYFGYEGDGGAARMAELYQAEGLTFDKAGNLYLADSSNIRVRKIAFAPPSSSATDASPTAPN
jgi:sugar lactone lactonase YvrE